MSPFGGFRKKRKQTDVRKNKLFQSNSFSLGVVAVVVVVAAVVRLLSRCTLLRERERRDTERERKRDRERTLPTKIRFHLP